MLYAMLGYAPRLAELSPGRILLLLVLEQAFTERAARYLDFGGQEFPYKAQFATDSMLTARVLYLRPTPVSAIVVAAHATVKGLWYLLSALRDLVRRLTRLLCRPD